MSSLLQSASNPPPGPGPLSEGRRKRWMIASRALRWSVALTFSGGLPLVGAALPGLIPLPASVQEGNTAGFVVTAETVLVATGEAAREAATVAARLRVATGYALPVQAAGVGIGFMLNPSLKQRLGGEGYMLESTPAGVRIVAAESAGLFYGGQTLLQLLPADAFCPRLVTNVPWTVPSVRIEDQPRFAWRGFMLDEARQFFGVDHAKRLLDTMALFKLNRLHWHLTDDEGWRIEIKAYPKLTSIGAWRGSDCALPNPRQEKHTRYGGFYTQEQLRDIVAYATARHIEIMPEVDMPGHSLALLTAYPELRPQGAGGGVSAQGFASNALSPAKPETYQLVETILGELQTVFTYQYIHIGGDEVNHDAWKDCPQIKALMAKEKLGNLHDVQFYFTKRLEKIFAASGKRIFGWNEVLDDRLERGTGIMAWTGTGPGYAAARKGFPVVMAPGQHCYFDMVYPGAQGEPPSHSWAGPVDNQRVYAFDPLGDGGALPPAAQARILGVHAALWSEFVQPWKGEVLDLPTYAAHAEYKTWPRLAALAEVGWTPQANRHYDDFEQRLGPAALRRIGWLGVRFRVPVPTATHKAGVLTIKPPFPAADVRYSLDGSLPNESSPRADGPLELAGRDAAQLRARTFLDGCGSTLLAGSQPQGVAEWSAKQLAAATGPLEFDLSAELTTPGIWRATFQFTGGAHAVAISEVELVINGASVAKDAHRGRAGGQHKDNTWRLVVAAVPAGAKVVLRAKFEGDGGKDSNGTISLQKSTRLEPATTVVTRLGGYAESTADKAADWDDATFFWVGSNPAAGDTVSWSFAEPLAAQSAAVLTGERGTTKDQAVGALLEYSVNGSEWVKLADFTYGHAEAALPAGVKIKGLRIRFSAPQKTWVIIHDPVLR